MAKTIEWHTETRKVDDLVPYDKNPRTLSEKQRTDLEASITKFSLAEIPAINTDNTIVAGHARLKVMQLLGRGQEEIDVRVPNRALTKKEFEEYLLRSNKNTGSWDYELLKGFDTEFLLDIGFDDGDLSDIWDDVLEIDDDEFNEEKELKKAEKTTIKTGDMFALGNHRLICGDSTNLEVIKKLMGGTKAQMVYCDPPYNIDLDYNKGVGGKASYGGSVDDKKSDTEYRAFLASIMKNTLSAPNVTE
jgi:hypothetical protein